ncbi:MAG: hypothetical protein Q9210_001580 [Variospora velana]
MADKDKEDFYRQVAMRKLQHVGKASARGEKDLNPEHTITDRDETVGLPPLHAATVQGNMQIIKDLLGQGLDIEDFSPAGETPLMLAASRSHHEAIQLLLVPRNHSVARQLISHGADVNHLSPDRWTALAEATYRGDKDMIVLLLKQGADTESESRSSHDWTHLMHACYRSDEAAVQLLLEAGASTDVSSTHDETAILLAAAGGAHGYRTSTPRTQRSAGARVGQRSEQRRRFRGG